MKTGILLILLLCSGCSMLKERRVQKEQLKSWGYPYWRQEFKDKVLCDCLLAGIGDEYVTNKFYTVDKSLYSPILIFDSLSKEIIKPVILKMRADSLASLTTKAEAAAGKRVLDTCLKLYKSKQLDSIVKAENKKWKKLKNIEDLVTKKIPSY